MASHLRPIRPVPATATHTDQHQETPDMSDFNTTPV